MTKLIILLFPSIAFANWTAFPDDGFTYSTQEVCEAKNGKCYELKNGIEKDTMKLEGEELVVDDAKKAAKDAAIAQEKANAQAKLDRKAAARALIKSKKALLDQPAPNQIQNQDIKALLKAILEELEIE